MSNIYIPTIVKQSAVLFSMGGGTGEHDGRKFTWQASPGGDLCIRYEDERNGGYFLNASETLEMMVTMIEAGIFKDKTKPRTESKKKKKG